jgi:hypothetical protein
VGKSARRAVLAGLKALEYLKLKLFLQHEVDCKLFIVFYRQKAYHVPDGLVFVPVFSRTHGW